MTIPPRQSGWSVAGEYTRLGIEHILLGIDHLLFVLALLLITRGGWKLVKTVTAFTVAHSITLAAATLGLVHVAQAPVEAAIALSIMFVAAEIIHGAHGQPRLATHAPWLVAFVFGLLHGFGFAGALREVGLPQSDIPVALLFFNVGVEVGQLMFILAVVTILWLASRLMGKQADGQRGIGGAHRGPPSRLAHRRQCGTTQRRCSRAGPRPGSPSVSRRAVAATAQGRRRT